MRTNDGVLGAVLTGLVALAPTVALANEPPVVFNASLSPRRADTETPLTVLHVSDDPDGDTIVDTRVTWRVDGAVVAGETDETLPPQHYSRGQGVQAEIEVSDGQLWSAPVASDVVVIENAAPRWVSLGGIPYTGAPIPFTVAEGEELRIDLVAEDPDFDPLTFSGGSLPIGMTLIDAALVWTPQPNQAGSYPDAIVRVTDGVATESVPIPLEVTETNQPPVVQNVRLDPVPVDVTTEVSALAVSSDPDGDPVVELSYRWLADGVEIAGEDDETLSAGRVVRGQSLLAEVRASDGELWSSPTASQPTVVINAPPSWVSIGGRPVDGSPLVFSIAEGNELRLPLVGTDPDGDAVGFGGTGLPVGMTLEGDAFVWTPTFGQAGTYDGGSAIVDDGTDFDSTPITFQVTDSNLPPTIGGVQLEPAVVFTDTPLDAAYAASDPDGDPILAADYRWWVDGVLAAGATEPTLAPDRFARDQVVEVDVAVWDGALWSEYVRSPARFVRNSAPAIERLGGVPIDGRPIAYTVQEGDVLELRIEASDADLDPITYQADVPPGATLVGDRVLWTPEFDQAGTYLGATVGASDGELTDSVAFDVVVRERNRPPELTVPGTQRVAERVELVVTLEASDPDGDAVAFAFENLPDGASFDAAAGELHWTPSAGQAGSYLVTVLATDDAASPLTVTAPLAIEVEPSFAIATGDGLELAVDGSGRLIYFGRGTNVVPGDRAGGLYLLDLDSASLVSELPTEGFVDAGDGLPIGWTLESATDASATLEDDGGATAALRLEASSSAAALRLVSDPVGVEPRTRWRVETGARTDHGYLGVGRDWDPHAIRIDVRWLDAAGNEVRTDVGVQVGYATRTWKTQGGVVTAPESADSAVLVLVLESSVPRTERATAWLRDVAFAPLTFPLTWPTGSVDADTPDALTLHLTDAELGLDATVTLTATAERIRIDGEVVNLDPDRRERAVDVGFGVPLDAFGWRWWDDPVRFRTVNSPSLYQNVVNVDETGWLPLGIYPVAAIDLDGAGYGFGRPMSAPRIGHVCLDATTETFAIVFAAGLSDRATRHAGRTSFTFDAFALPEPDWGMRSAIDRYYRLEPESFAERIVDGLPARSSGEVIEIGEDPPADPQAFNVRYLSGRFHTPSSAEALDEALDYGWTPLGYTRPWDTNVRPWPLTEPPPRYETVLEQVAAEAVGETLLALRQQGALNAFVHEHNGDVQFQRLDEAPASGDGLWNARLPLDLDPELGGVPNGATAAWDYDLVPSLDTIVTNAPGLTPGWYLDGFFSSSSHLTSRDESFASADLPIAYSSNRLRPAPHVLMRNLEFLEWATDRLDAEYPGVWVAGNFNALGSSGLGAHLVDLFIYELDPDGVVPDTLDAYRLYRRFLARYRPVSELYLRLDGTVPWPTYDEFEENYLLPQWHSMLLYGMHPAAINTMLETGVEIDPARPLYAQMVPVLTDLQNAGWQPLTFARSLDARLRLERYGEAGEVFWVIHNPTDTTVSTLVILELARIGLSSSSTTVERLDDVEVPGSDYLGSRRVDLTVPARRSLVLQVTEAP